MGASHGSCAAKGMCAVFFDRHAGPWQRLAVRQKWLPWLPASVPWRPRACWYVLQPSPCYPEPMHCPPACLAPIGRRLRHQISLSLHAEALDPMVLRSASPLCPPSSLQVCKQRQEFLLLPRHDDGEKHAVMQGNTHLPTPCMGTPPEPPIHSFTACPLEQPLGPSRHTHDPSMSPSCPSYL